MMLLPRTQAGVFSSPTVIVFSGELEIQKSKCTDKILGWQKESRLTTKEHTAQFAHGPTENTMHILHTAHLPFLSINARGS